MTAADLLLKDSHGSQPMLELCVGGIDDVLLAQQAAVPRIELNSAIALGGLTPSLPLLQHARTAYDGTIIAMVRPREGDFLYSAAEIRLMLQEAETLLQAGADGIAIGFLNHDRTINSTACKQLRQQLPSAHLVFHRAFDVSSDLPLALNQLIDLGFQTVLTSGGCHTALAGAAVLRALRQQAAGRIQILPGGGIRAANVHEVLQLTGCHEVHAAVREICEPPPSPYDRNLHFGIPGHGPLSYGRTSHASLTDLLKALKNSPLNTPP
jgi:copper homeostasis protein